MLPNFCCLFIRRLKMSKIFLPTIALSSIFLAMGSLSTFAEAKTQNIDDKIFTTTSAIAPTYLAQSTTTAALERKALIQINQHRARRGLPALTANATITQQARLHSQNMASGRVRFSHQGFQQRLQAIARVIPIRAMAENIAYNSGYSDPVTVAVQGWLKSPGHKINIEGNYNLTGIGVAKSRTGAYYFTQVFVRNR
jgi:uncharacterized protein YkwD